MKKRCRIFTSKKAPERLPETSMQKCLHFKSCSQNFCPLDPDLNLRSGKKQDKCRFMREPKLVKIRGREFVSGGTIMPDALLNFVLESNLERLNTSSKARRAKINQK